MKRLFLLLTCAMAVLCVSAQDKEIAISKADASSAQGGEEASNAIDGNYGTLWHSPHSGTTFPIDFTITLNEPTHVDYVRYVPRQGNSNGNWNEVEIFYCPTTTGEDFISVKSYDLKGSSAPSNLFLGDKGVECGQIKITIKSGANGFAAAAELEVYAIDYSKEEMYAQYFEDDLFSQLKPSVTSSEGIEDATLKALVDNLLNNAEGYKKFRVGEYEPYLTTSTLQRILQVKSQYNNYENPTGIYLKGGESCWVAVSGIDYNYPVGLTIKNWVQDENSSSYSLHNGLNYITAPRFTEGNVFVHYYTDDFEKAPNVKVHFINASVQGYWDQATMTNEDWLEMLKGRSSDDNTILITRSEHAQLAFPVSAWLTHCPTNIDSTMTLYQQVQWAERDILGLEKYGRQVKNRQLYYATTYGFMAAGGEGAYCNVNSLGGIMKPDAKNFDFWGVGHEWGHNNQVSPGFHWSGCGETTNNIYASWAQYHFTGNRDSEGNPTSLRLEDEWSGIDEYSSMRGGRMQTYFEEALRKGVAWQLQDGPDYHGATPDTKVVKGEDANGNSMGDVTTTSRNYDHFVKLVPFWQLNLWGTLAKKCPDIITMVLESIRTTPNYGSTYNTNGKQQVNWMKLACDSAKIDLLPFFEKAGMLRPINAYIEDYGAGWNIITEKMISDLKAYVKEKGYPAFTEEINYINAYNHHIYRDCLKLGVPEKLGTGCSLKGNKVTVQHKDIKNAVAFETYNFTGELLRITMYGLGSDDTHSYTQVLFPKNNDVTLTSAYIMAVGYDGTRTKIYEVEGGVESLLKNAFVELLEKAKISITKTDDTGTKVGYLIPEHITEYSSLVTRLDESYENTDEEEARLKYKEWYLELRDATNDLMSNKSAQVDISHNSFYSISLVNTNRLLGDIVSGLATDTNNEDTTPYSMQWKFVKAKEEGTFYIQQRVTGNYLSEIASSGRVRAKSKNKADAIAFTLVTDVPGEHYIQRADDATKRLYNNSTNQACAGSQNGDNAKWTIQLEDDMLALPETSSEEQLIIYHLLRTSNNDYTYQSTGRGANGRLSTGMFEDHYDQYYWFYFYQGSQEGKYTIYNYNVDEKKRYPVTSDANGNLYANKTVDVVPEYTIALNKEGNAIVLSGEGGNWAIKEDAATRKEFIVLNPEDSITWKMQRVRTISLTNEPLESITISSKEEKIVEGKTITLTVETAPVFATNHSVTWSSDNTEVATVDAEGTVTAIAKGTATITATANDGSGVSATCKVTVEDGLLKSITISKKSAELFVGDDITLTVTTAPDYATDHSVTWSSDNTEVAIVDTDGKVTAIAEGTATITATANDGSGVSASCKVTVKKKDAGISTEEANLLSVQSQEGVITINGLNKGTVVSVYNTVGGLVATTIAKGNTISINTGMTDRVVIVKVGEHNVKVAL